MVNIWLNIINHSSLKFFKIYIIIGNKYYIDGVFSLYRFNTYDDYHIKRRGQGDPYRGKV